MVSRVTTEAPTDRATRNRPVAMLDRRAIPLLDRLRTLSVATGHALILSPVSTQPAPASICWQEDASRETVRLTTERLGQPILPASTTIRGTHTARCRTIKGGDADCTVRDAHVQHAHSTVSNSGDSARSPLMLARQLERLPHGGLPRRSHLRRSSINDRARHRLPPWMGSPVAGVDMQVSNLPHLVCGLPSRPREVAEPRGDGDEATE